MAIFNRYPERSYVQAPPLRFDKLPNDVIGGPLEYYDPPTSPIVPPVVNVRDPDATTPVVAHGEYYEHSLLYDLIAAWHQA